MEQIDHVYSRSIQMEPHRKATAHCYCVDFHLFPNTGTDICSICSHLKVVGTDGFFKIEKHNAAHSKDTEACHHLSALDPPTGLP